MVFKRKGNEFRRNKRGLHLREKTKDIMRSHRNGGGRLNLFPFKGEKHTVKSHLNDRRAIA